MISEWNPEKYAIVQKQYQDKYGRDLITLLNDFIEIRDKNILDLGCGDGNLSYSLLKAVGEKGKVTAIDIDSGMINAAREKYGINQNIYFYDEDIMKWFLNDNNSYDIVFSNAVLHWLDSDEELNNVISSVYNHLKPEGYFVFRFSLQGHAEKAKQFLEKNLRRFLSNNNLEVKRSIFTFEKSVDFMKENKFSIVYSEEKIFKSFEDEDMNFKWLVFSQPLLKYIHKEQYDSFVKFLWEEWLKDKVEVEGYQGIFIGKRL